MSLASSVRSLSGGVITFLGVLTLLATQQPLLASQVDDTRLGAPFVSYLDGDIVGQIQKVGDTVKNNTLEVDTKVDQCAALITNSGQCKPVDNSTDFKLESESQCKARHEQFECHLDVVCRLCDQVAIAALVQNSIHPDSVKYYANCTKLGFEYKIECPSSLKSIILIAVGVLAVLGIGGGAFMMLRGGRKSGSRTGGINKNRSSTGAGTSKSATKSAKAGSSTGGTSGLTPSGPARV